MTPQPFRCLQTGARIPRQWHDTLTFPNLPQRLALGPGVGSNQADPLRHHPLAPTGQGYPLTPRRDALAEMPGKARERAKLHPDRQPLTAPYMRMV